MADSKITALTAISTVDPTADPLVIVDVSDTSMAASGTTKKSTINQLLGVKYGNTVDAVHNLDTQGQCETED